MNRFLFLALCCLFIYPSMAQNQPSTDRAKSVLLKMNLQPETSYRFTTNTAQTITQDIMGNQVNIKQESSVDYLFEVLKNTGDGLQIKSTYQALSLHMQSPQGTVTFDTKDSSSQQGPLKALGQMIGKSFTMYVNPEGAVVKVTGMKELMNAISTEGANRQVLEQYLSDSSFMNMMNASMNIYPNQEIKPGESWNKDFKMPLAGMLTMDVQTQYTLQGVDQDRARVTAQSQIRLSPLESATGLFAEMDIQLNGVQTSDIQLEVPTGLMLSSKIHQDIKGNIGVQGHQVPMTIQSEINLTGKALDSSTSH